MITIISATDYSNEFLNNFIYSIQLKKFKFPVAVI